MSQNEAIEGAQVGDLPVNVRPNTSSFCGTSSLGVVVLVIEREEGSMSPCFIVDAAWAWMLYCLEAANSFEGDCLKTELRGRN
jgi:hypothetical protein